MLFIIKLNVVISCFFVVGCSGQEVCFNLEPSSCDTYLKCPGQRFHLTCQTNSSFKGWYINNDILALLNDQQTNWTSDDYYAVYFPDKNWSILEIRNASKSFEVGCGSSSMHYDASMVIVLEGHNVAEINCTYDVNNTYNININVTPPATNLLSVKDYSLTLHYKDGKNITSFFKTPNIVIRPNTPGLREDDNAQIIITDVCDRESSISLNLNSDCTIVSTDPGPTATTTNATTSSSTKILISLLGAILLPVLLIVTKWNPFFLLKMKW